MGQMWKGLGLPRPGKVAEAMGARFGPGNNVDWGLLHEPGLLWKAIRPLKGERVEDVILMCRVQFKGGGALIPFDDPDSLLQLSAGDGRWDIRGPEDSSTVFFVLRGLVLDKGQEVKIRALDRDVNEDDVLGVAKADWNGRFPFFLKGPFPAECRAMERSAAQQYATKRGKAVVKDTEKLEKKLAKKVTASSSLLNFQDVRRGIGRDLDDLITMGVDSDSLDAAVERFEGLDQMVADYLARVATVLPPVGTTVKGARGTLGISVVKLDEEAGTVDLEIKILKKNKSFFSPSWRPVNSAITPRMIMPDGDTSVLDLTRVEVNGEQLPGPDWVKLEQVMDEGRFSVTVAESSVGYPPVGPSGFETGLISLDMGFGNRPVLLRVR